LYAFFLTLLRDTVGSEQTLIAGSGLDAETLVSVWDALVRPLLGTLAVTMAPVTLQQLAELSGTRADGGAVRAALARVQQFLTVEDGRYRLFHPTMQTFLTGQRHYEFMESGAQWHARIAGNVLRAHGAQWSGNAAEYALAYLPAHLVAAIPAAEQAAGELVSLLCSLDYATEKIRRYGIDLLLVDLHEAVAALPGEQRIGDLLRIYSLEAHHLRSSNSGITLEQQLHLRAADLQIQWAEVDARNKQEASGRPLVRRLWGTHLNSPDLLTTMSGHEEWVTDLACTPGGEKVISVSDLDATARLWEIRTGRCLRILRTPSKESAFVTVAIAASGTWAVLGDKVGGITFWDLESGQSRILPVTHSKAILALTVALDGATVVSGCGDGIVKCWNGHTGEMRGKQRLGRAVHALAAGPLSSRVAIGAGNFREPVPLTVWDLASGDLKHVESEANGINGLAVTPDGRYAVLAGDTTGEVWDLKILVRTGTFNVPWRTMGRTRPVAVSPGARHAVFASGDTVEVIEPTSNRVVQRLTGHAVNVMAVALTDDGAIVVSGGQDRTIKTWRFHETAEPGDPSQAHTGQVNAIALTPQRDRVLSVSQDATLKVWDTETGTLIHTCQDKPVWMQSLALSDDGRYALTGYIHWLGAWDLRSGKRAFELPVVNVDGIRALLRFPDNRFFALGSAEGDIYLFRDGAWEQIGPLKGHIETVNMLSMPSDGSPFLASASDDRTVRIWDLRSFKSRSLVHESSVLAVCYSPDGRAIISGAHDGVIRVWDADTANLTAQWQAHGGWITGLTVSADGRYLVSVSEDATLAIWDPNHHNIVVRVGLEQVLWCVSEFTPDGLVAVGDVAGGVHVLRVALR
jgi:WD40 repeat protein